MSKYTGRLAKKIRLERGPANIIEYLEQLDREDEPATAGIERQLLEKMVTDPMTQVWTPYSSQTC